MSIANLPRTGLPETRRSHSPAPSAYIELDLPRGPIGWQYFLQACGMQTLNEVLRRFIVDLLPGNGAQQPLELEDLVGRARTLNTQLAIAGQLPDPAARALADLDDGLKQIKTCFLRQDFWAIADLEGGLEESLNQLRQRKLALSVVLEQARLLPHDEKTFPQKRRRDALDGVAFPTKQAKLSGYRDNNAICGLYQRRRASEIDVLKVTTARIDQAPSSQLAQQCFDRMRCVGVMPNAVSYNSLIGAYSKVGDVTGAMKVFYEMCSHHLTPDSFTFHNLIKTYANARNSQGAEAVFRQMIAAGIEPDVYIYCSLMTAYCNVGDPQGVRQVFSEMRAAGELPTVVCYNILINAYANADNPKGAQTVLDEMRANNITPDVVSYSTVIGAYGNVHDSEGARRAFNKIRTNGLKPNSFSYQHLITACSKAGDQLGAQEAFNMLSRSGKGLNIFSYTGLIACHARCNDPTSAQRVFNEMIASGLRPDLHCYNALLSAYASASDSQGAQEIFDQVMQCAEADANLTPDIVIYTTLMSAYANVGDVRNAQRVLDEMLNAGLNPDSVAYSHLITAHGNAGNRHDAKDVFKAMKRAGVQPDIASYRALLAVCVNVGDPSGAQQAFDEMCRNHIAPDVSIYVLLIAGYRRQPDEQRRLLQAAIVANLLKPELGYSESKNKLDFHVNAVFAGRPCQGHEPGIPSELALAVFDFHHHQGHLKVGTRVVVGHHGHGKIREAIRTRAHHLGWIPSEARDFGGKLNPGMFKLQAAALTTI